MQKKGAGADPKKDRLRLQLKHLGSGSATLINRISVDAGTVPLAGMVVAPVIRPLLRPANGMIAGGRDRDDGGREGDDRGQAGYVPLGGRPRLVAHNPGLRPVLVVGIKKY